MQTWDLLLNRPYNDGGSEDSRRIDPENGWTMLPPLYCAVHVNGPINDPSVENDGWSVEIALPLASLMERQAEAGCGPDKTPAEGVLWRLGFRCPLSMPPTPLPLKFALHFSCTCVQPATAISPSQWRKRYPKLMFTAVLYPVCLRMLGGCGTPAV